MGQPRPMLPTVNLPAPRCATCTQWEARSMGVGVCALPGRTAATIQRPAYVDGGLLFTRLDFGCIFHEKAVDL